MTRKKFLRGAIVSILLGFIGTAGIANAAYWGPGSGGGGLSGCSEYTLSTCYGATWRYYKWSDVESGNYPDMWIENGSVRVQGLGSSSSNAYAATGLISSDCKAKGGFWRYAMVASKDHTYGSGISVTKGQQVGLIAINGNADWIYNSKYFGGGMAYRDSEQGEVNWDEPFEIYNELKKRYEKENEYPLSWTEGSAGNLAWFCAPEDITAEFSTISNISVDKIGGYSTTGKNSGALKTVYTVDVRNVKVGDTVTVTFSQDVFSTTTANGVEWAVTRDKLSSNDNYDVTQVTGSGLTTAVSGKNDFTVLDNGSYVSSVRNGDSGGQKYLSREQFNIKFKKKNSSGYTFCEMIGVKKDGVLTNHTRVCTKIIVDGGPGDDDDPDCPDGECPPDDDDDDPGGGPQQLCRNWAPTSYNNSGDRYGVTSVVSRIINERLSGRYSGWRGEIDEGTSPQTNGIRSDWADLRITYAKPGDEIKWVNCYWPGVQKVANTERTYIEAPDSGDGNNWNDNRIESSSVFGAWENKYNIESKTDSSSSFSGASPASGSLATGDSYTRASSNSQNINALRDVGKYFQETISGGYSPVYVSLGNQQWHSWGCYWGTCCCCDLEDGCSCDCWCSTCYHNNHYTGLNARNSGPVVSGAARVEVPYNFNNEAGVKVSVTSFNTQDAVYAGETIRVNEPYVKVKSDKYNSLTEDSYATVVDEAQVRLIAYASSSPVSGVRIEEGYNAGSDVCSIIKDDLGGYCETVKRVDNTRLNEGGDLNGAEYYNNIRGISFNGVYNVFDVDAGNQMCFAMAVYPYTSGADNNLSAEGDKKWFISVPACKVVAKKPSVQILGAGVFSAGSIRTNTSDKINILGIAGYTSQGASDRRVFGSWAEQAVIANGSVEGFASGAATGTWNLYGLDSDKLGGSWEGDTTSFCNNRVSLSFANTSSSYITGICPGAEATGRLGITVSTVNRQALVDYFAAGTKVEGSNGWDGFGSYVRIASGTGKNILYSEEENNSYNISGGTVGGDTTRVVKVTGNVNINNNILYSGATSQNYALVKTGGTVTVPKVVIYASGNINIACDVKEIDAILIAGGTISTCSGFSATDTNTWQNPTRNNKLTIRGAVVANRIDFGRTYGNTTGLGTKEPAEQINYDTSSILWGRSMADAGESDTLTVVYQHELAPRY